MKRITIPNRMTSTIITGIHTSMAPSAPAIAFVPEFALSPSSVCVLFSAVDASATAVSPTGDGGDGGVGSEGGDGELPSVLFEFPSPSPPPVLVVWVVSVAVVLVEVEVVLVRVVVVVEVVQLPHMTGQSFVTLAPITISSHFP